eukprot:m.1473233 g.1473233  ORF g.1473233 m.1473233 type:complete len:1281 (-) comp25152_c1_seq8:3346-7188(-)
MKSRSKTVIAVATASAFVAAYLIKSTKSRQRRQAANARSSNTAKKKKQRRDGFKDVVMLLKQLVPHTKAEMLGLAGYSVIRTILNDFLARLQGRLFEATFKKDPPLFVRLIVEILLGSLAFSTLKSTIDYHVSRISWTWRRLLNRKIEQDYFSDMTYYKVAFVDKRIQSPEQVIVNDTEVVTSELGMVCSKLIGAAIDGSYFTWRVAQQTSLVWACIPLAYISMCGVLVSVITPNFTELFSLKTKAEEALRSVFSNLRTHAEAIAAYGGGARELSLLEARLNDALHRSRALFRTQGWFGVLQDYIAKYCVTTVATFVIMYPFFGGRKGSASDISGRAKMLSRMRYLTSITVLQLAAVGYGIVGSLQMLLKIKSYASRVAELMAVLRDCRSKYTDQHTTSVTAGPEISFQHVDVETPMGTRLVTDLSFAITPGKNMLLTGPNGSGKSSIFRCLGALWAVKSGTITKPTSRGGRLCGAVFYLPQKPYNVVGNLRDQLTYPTRLAAAEQHTISDEKLAYLLRLVDLEYLMQRASARNVNWETELSLGETQRLAMARLFYHCPTYAILDECTSGVSNDMEVRLYKLCAKLGITCVTISHRPALEAFHHQKLALDGHGSYSVCDIEGGASLVKAAYFDDTHTSTGMDVIDSILGGAGSRTNSLSSVFTTDDEESDDESEAVAAKSIRQRAQTAAYPPLAVPVKGTVRGLASVFGRLCSILHAHSGTAMVGKLLLVTGMVVFRVYLSDRMAHITGNNLRALLAQDLPLFLSLQVQSLMQSAVQAIVAPSLVYVARSLALDWRRVLSQHLFANYLGDKAFYKVGNLYHLVEDGDQRLTEDLSLLSTEMANIFPDIVKPLADISWFTYQAYGIIGLQSTAMLYLYMFAGYGVLRAAAPAYGKLVEKSQELAGAFRYVHTRLRTHAESVAFFGGDAVEGEICHAQFNQMVQHDKTVAHATWHYEILNDFIIQQFPAIVSWLLSFLYTLRQRNADVYADKGGQLSHDLRYVSAVVSHTFISFGELLQLQKRVLELSGYAQRLLDFDVALTSIQAYERTHGDANVVDSTEVAFADVDIVTPTGTCLASKVSFTVPQGSNLLVTGPNVSGKSSLFRVLGGLWPVRSGRLHRPLARPTDPAGSISTVFMVPQRPYNAIGSLAQQITYPVEPDLTDAATVATLDELMRMVKLSHLLERQAQGWGTTANWADVLSLGEQQRLGMARLFYHRPRYAVLDQCTDAVSVDVEDALYTQAKALGITIITISQRPGLTGHHDQHVRLIDGAGHWDIADMH